MQGIDGVISDTDQDDDCAEEDVRALLDELNSPKEKDPKTEEETLDRMSDKEEDEISRYPHVG